MVSLLFQKDFCSFVYLLQAKDLIYLLMSITVVLWSCGLWLGHPSVYVG